MFSDKLFNGEVGVVKNENDWDEDKNCLVINNNEYCMLEEVNDIDGWYEENKNNIDLNNLVLFTGYGYYEDKCCSGYYNDVKNNKEYGFDISGESMVYEIEKI